MQQNLENVKRAELDVLRLEQFHDLAAKTTLFQEL